MSNFSSNLKFLRMSVGETQESLANALFVEKSTISQYESGTRKPNDQETLKKIAKRYGVTVDSLLSDDFSSNSPDLVAFMNNPDRILQEMIKIFPIYELDDTYCPEYLKAYKEHEKLLFGSLEEKETVDVDFIADTYGKALTEYKENSDAFLVTLVNVMSLKLLRYSSTFSDKFSNQMKDFKSKKNKNKKDIKALITDVVLPNINDNEIKTPQFKKAINEFFLPNIELLKETQKYSKVADYFFILRYICDLVDNDEDFATNQLTGYKLIYDLARINNPYAIHFLEIVKKFT